MVDTITDDGAFQTSKQNISLHIGNVFKEGELEPEAVD